MKSRAWYIHFPGDPYALGPVRFEQPVSERELRAWVRAWAGLRRLPRGFSCWRA